MNNIPAFSDALRLLALAGAALFGASIDAGEVLLLPESGRMPEGQIPREERFVFAGETREFRWLLRDGAGDELTKAVLDAHRVAGSTAVPLGELPVASGPATTTPESPVELSASFETPASDRPATYLLRLWNEAEGKRTLLSSVVLHVVPEAILSGVKGLTIQAVAFDPATRDGWAKVFSESGARIEWLDSLPPASDRADLILCRRDPASPELSPSELAAGQTLVYFEEGIGWDGTPPVDRIVESAGKGRVLKISMNVLRTLEHDAGSRARLTRLLDSAP